MSANPTPTPLEAAQSAWIDAFNRAEVDAIAALYTTDVVLMPPGEPELSGREAVRAWLAGFFAANEASQTLVNDEVRIAGEWAFVRGAFEVVTTPKSGGPPTRVRGKHLVVWRRDSDGAWRAHRDIWNTDHP